jgi:PIN domain nuclease of toxin-antitoxin system
VRYLLDTHALIWWWNASPRLGKLANAILGDRANDIFVSSASAWEIATKFRLGKLDEVDDPMAHFAPLMDKNGFLRLSVTEEHALLAGSVNHEHRDPFDRLIAAQAMIEGMPLVTLDPAMKGLGCATIW